MDPAAEGVRAPAGPGPRAVIDEILRTGAVRDAHGAGRPLHSSVSRVEGEHLSALIAAHPGIVTTLEIGCAYGISALYMCDALRDRPGARHTIIDPVQTGVWEGIGIAQLERAGIDFFELIEEPSELALPELLRRAGPDSFDFVFIDGWHTFDQVIVDLYFANRLVRPGGFIALDDCDWPAVATALSYVETYPHIATVSESAPPPASLRQRIGALARRLLPPRIAQWVLPAAVYLHHYARVRHPSLTILRKTGEDTRRFDFYAGH